MGIEQLPTMAQAQEQPHMGMEQQPESSAPLAWWENGGWINTDEVNLIAAQLKSKETLKWLAGLAARHGAVGRAVK